MAKKVLTLIKLQIPGGQANPAPPVGPALGAHGVNIMGFVKEYNEKTAAQVGTIIPVEITVFEDRSFSFILKTPPAADLLRKAAGVDVGSNRRSPAERRQSPLAGSLVPAARKSVPAVSRWAATAPDSTTSRSGPGMTRLATTAPGR